MLFEEMANSATLMLFVMFGLITVFIVVYGFLQGRGSKTRRI
jgi:hypothetical protein